MQQSRRNFLVSSSALMLGAGALGAATAAPTDEPSLVFAHLTDMHIKPTGGGPAGLPRCLAHAQAHPAKPKFILNGGDAIMSALGATAESTREQWAQYHALMKEHCQLPVRNVIGNHDCWGFQRSKAGTTGNEPLYGKAWAHQELQLESGYYTFDDGGWRFFILDSVQDRGDGGYLPVIDDEQFAWLEAGLAAMPREMPAILVSHVPILGVTPFFFVDDIVKNYQFNVIGALMHQDVHRIVKMLRSHPQVKLAISGHCHLVDSVVFEGITYMCNGAVSGSWWNGPYQNCPPGYAIVKLWRDGSFEREYVPYDEA